MSHSLDHIMKPSSVAVIGASTKPHTIGSDLMKRLIEFGFKGRIYPVNPKGGMIEGLQAYPSVLDIEGPVDMAVIVVNSKFVLSTIDQCHEKGVKGLVVISAGFKESGKEGAEMEAQLYERVKKYGMRCVGPNCLGVVNTHPDVRMDACFADNVKARVLQSDGTYALCPKEGAPVDSQQLMMDQALRRQAEGPAPEPEEHRGIFRKLKGLFSK